jgi:flagellar hook-associated protein 1 FlgK
MNLSGLLSIGNNGLNAASHGTQVASNNISNAATPGYTRRSPILVETPTGVKIGGTERVNDQFLEKRGLNANSGSGDADARVQTLSVLDSVFADGTGSVGEALDQFETSLADLSGTPNSSAVRSTVLARASDLAQAFHRTADALDGARQDANGRITEEVGQVNQKLDKIGDLTQQIVSIKATKQDAGDLEDQRDQLIRDVSGDMPVTAIYQDNGGVTLQLNGARTLVSVDGGVHHLIASPNATNGNVTISRETNGAVEDITSFFTSGMIGGTIAARDGALQTAQQQLDQMASDITTAYNTQHALGVGLDGNTGRNLFNTAATGAGAATAFDISADVAGHPEFLGAAQDANSLPGDNRNALALVAMRDQKIGLSGTATAQQSFTAMVGAAGAATNSAVNQQTAASATKSTVDALRESASGVSTDEEMINLMKFQRAYQASLKVIETADSMLSDLLNMNIGG